MDSWDTWDDILDDPLMMTVLMEEFEEEERRMDEIKSADEKLAKEEPEAKDSQEVREDIPPDADVPAEDGQPESETEEAIPSPEEETAEEEAEPEEPESPPEKDEMEELKGLEPVLKFDYNVTNAEEEEAFLTFQRKYVYKHNWKITAAFGAVALVFLLSIIRKPSGYLNWVLFFICLVMIFVTWFNTVRIRKYLMSALKPLEDDKYRFTLYDDRFVIETVFTEAEKAEEDFIPVKPRIVMFKDIGLNIIENTEMFILILKKETIYVLSKRVMNEEQQRVLRNSFSELLGEDYEIMDGQAG